MQTPPTFDVVERRIQTLTSILQKMDRPCFDTPTSDQSKEAPLTTFLRHLATLLSCGASDDPGPAVTATLTAEGLRTLIVYQNPSGSSDVSEFGVQQITKSSGTFEEVVKQKNDANLKAHISDVWAAIALFDPTDKSHYLLFYLFIVTRCFRKLSKLVYQDRECWNVRICQNIYDWTPDEKGLDGVQVRWIDRPNWAPYVLPPDSTGPDGMTVRKIQKSGELVTQWEFSAATLKSWAWLLAKILEKLELSVAATKDAQEKKQTEQEVEGMADVNRFCLILKFYVYGWNEVVKTLLTNTSLAHQFHSRVPLKTSEDTEPDNVTDMRKEPYESEGDRVLRHLRGIVSWHVAAVNLLSNKNYQQFTQSLFVGFVEVAPTKLGPDLMTNEEVIHEFLSRYPRSSPEVRDSIMNIIRNNHIKEKFTGTTHAFATLIGLLTYFSPRSCSVFHGPPMGEDDLGILRWLVELAPKAIAVAVGKKCCGGCGMLGNLLWDIDLPGSHGVISAWSPPRVGLDLTVLQDLENNLWNELYRAIFWR